MTDNQTQKGCEELARIANNFGVKMHELKIAGVEHRVNSAGFIIRPIKSN